MFATAAADGCCRLLSARRTRRLVADEGSDAIACQESHSNLAPRAC